MSKTVFLACNPNGRVVGIFSSKAAAEKANDGCSLCDRWELEEWEVEGE